MASVVTKFARKCQILENSVFYLGGKKKKHPEKNLRKLSKCCILTLLPKTKKNVLFPITIEFVILEM